MFLLFFKQGREIIFINVLSDIRNSKQINYYQLFQVS
jgi:hypothetical protein